jgi:hypothetical protein
MRTPLLSLAALILLSAPAHAQLTAGEVPNGMSALELNIDIALSTPFTADSASLELDCDDSMDAWAVLYRGAPEIDGPNVALLRFMDDDIEMCASIGIIFQQRPKYHAYGELLDCAGDFEWQSANPIVLGDFGGFTAIGPYSMDSMYVAYRRGAQVGWILLSFDVQGGLDPVQLQIHQVLPLCPSTTSIVEHDLAPITLFPNPSNGGPIRVESADELRSIDVLDAAGRTVAHFNGMARTFPAPITPGTYLVQLTHADGRRSLTQLVRY